MVIRTRDETRAGFKAIQDSLKGTTEETKKAKGAFDDLKKSFLSGIGIGGGFAVGQKAAELFGQALRALPAAAIAAVQDLARLGSQLSDLSARTDISIGALQELKFAGSLVGVSLDQVTQSVGIMQRNLASGAEAFGKLGLSAAELKGMKPEEAFAAVAREIQRLPNAADQARAAMEVFGRGGLAMLPLLKSGFEDAASEARHLGAVLDDETVAAADHLDDATAKLNATWDGLRNQFAAVIVSNPELIGGLEDLITTIGGIGRAASENREALSDFVRLMTMAVGLSEPIRALQTTAALAGGAAPGVRTPRAQGAAGQIDFGDIDARALAATQEQVKAYEKARQEQVKADEKAAKESERIAKALADAQAETMQWLYEQQLGYYDDLEEAAAESGAAVAKLQQEWADRQVEIAGDKAEQILKVFTDQLNAEQDMMAAMGAYAEQVERERVEAEARAIQDRIEGWHSLGQAFVDAGDLLVVLGADADNVLVRMADQFANVSHAVGGFLAALASGNIFDKIGAGIGLVVSAVGAVKGIFQDEEVEVNDLRDAFFEAQGGFESLQQKLSAVTNQDLIRKIFDATTVEEFNAAVAEAMGLLDRQGESIRLTNEAIERYGFTIEELGPKFAQQKLDEQFAVLFQDYQLLTAAGVDHNAIIARMGPSLQEYVNSAIKAGGTIPEAMRPVIEEMIKNGQLLDENGQAYESVEDAGIHFAETLTEGIGRLIDRIDELVNALLGIPNVERTVTIHTQNTGDDGGKDGDPKTPMWGGGVVTQWGVPAVLHGTASNPEYALRREHLEEIAAMMSSNGGSAGPSSRTPIVIQLDGRAVANLVAEYSRDGKLRIHPAAITAAGF